MDVTDPLHLQILFEIVELLKIFLLEQLTNEVPVQVVVPQVTFYLVPLDRTHRASPHSLATIGLRWHHRSLVLVPCRLDEWYTTASCHRVDFDQVVLLAILVISPAHSEGGLIVRVAHTGCVTRKAQAKLVHQEL